MRALSGKVQEVSCWSNNYLIEHTPQFVMLQRNVARCRTLIVIEKDTILL